MLMVALQEGGLARNREGIWGQELPQSTPSLIRLSILEPFCLYREPGEPQKLLAYWGN